MNWLYLFYIVSITLAYKHNDPLRMVYLKGGHQVPAATLAVTMIFLKDIKHNTPLVWSALYDYAAFDIPILDDDITAILEDGSFIPLHDDIRAIIKSAGRSLQNPVESEEEYTQRRLYEFLKHQKEHIVESA